MKDNKYEKIRENVFKFLEKIPYSEKDREIISSRIAQELCEEQNEKMKYCTKKQTDAYRKLMGLENNGERKSYTSVEKELNKTNIRGLVNTATTHLIRGIRKEIYNDNFIEEKRHKK